MNPFIGAAKVLTRLLAFIGRELVEVMRRPGALASLVFGPFLIMAVFGIGYNGFKKPLPTLIVIPPSSELPTDVAGLPRPVRRGARDRRRRARPRPRRRRGSSRARSRSSRSPRRTRGSRSRPASSRRSRSRSTSPTRSRPRTPGLMADQFAASINQEIIRRAAEEGQAEAEAQGLPDAGRIPPEVIAAPDRGEDRQHRADRADGRRVLRARRPRADPPAHGRDADRAVGRARADERRDRAVPHLAGLGVGGRRGQDPRLRLPGRGRSRSPASRCSSSASACRCSGRPAQLARSCRC